MHSDLQNLLSLQQADREIARLRQEIASLPGKVAVIEEKLAGSRAQLEKAKAAIKAGEAARRKHEADIQALQQKISKYRDQSLEVKTNEQYKALLHEIGFAEQGIREAEDKILETMAGAEEQERLVKVAERELKEETAEIEKEKADVRSRTEQDERELAEWNRQRDSLRSQIAESTLMHYDRVVGHRGSGVAEVFTDKCTACHVLLRPQLFNDVKTNSQIIPCSNCGRILVYREPAETPAPPAVPAEVASGT
jgi:predicted  nucleic acid-binding Zn-ribbon protein